MGQRNSDGFTFKVVSGPSPDMIRASGEAPDATRKGDKRGGVRKTVTVLPFDVNSVDSIPWILRMERQKAVKESC